MSEQSVAEPDVGYRITHDGAEKIRAVVNWPRPYATETPAAIALPYAGTGGWQVILFPDETLDGHETVICADRDQAARLVRVWARQLAKLAPEAVVA